MGSNNWDSRYGRFTQSAKPVSVPPQFDAKGYSNSYTGFIKYQRLIFIAEQCPELKNEALQLAHDYVKSNTFDISRYEYICDALDRKDEQLTGDIQDVSNNFIEVEKPELPTFAMDAEQVGFRVNRKSIHYDTNWVQETCARVMKQREDLETELRNYKANSIKECARRGCIDLGDFYLKTGDLGSALKHYTHSRDYCTSRQQDLLSCLHILKVAIYQGAWSHVSVYITHAENIAEAQIIQNRSKENNCKDGVNRSTLDSTTLSDLAVATGLAKLMTSDYYEAAINFLKANYEPTDSTSGNVATLVTVSDLAFYVTLCALATFDRNELRIHVLSNSSFRLILESEVRCRDFLTAFHTADYTNCLNALAKVKNLLKLDLFLAAHVDKLYQRIRVKALCQYFTPYVSADLNMMATVFNTNVVSLEEELATLIQKGSIKGRIDSHRKLLCALSVDQRCITFANVMQLVDEFHRHCQAAVLRANIIRKAGNRSWSIQWPQYEQNQEAPMGHLMFNKPTNT